MDSNSQDEAVPDTQVPTLPDTQTSAHRLPRGLILLLAVVAGASVANIYYNQPILSLIAHSFNVPGATAAQVVAATQFGYAAGLVLLVPLGDGMDRRKLILWQAAGLVAALGLVMAAPTLLMLTVASVAVGIGATIAQQVVPIAAGLAAPEHRGRTVGTVMSGLLAGVLLARTISGAVGGAFGWRVMYGFGMAVAVAVFVALYAFLPGSPAAHPHPYGRLLASLGQVLRRYRVLQRAALVQGLLFACFSVFWATLALRLESPAFGLGPVYAGLFGVLGLVGVVAAPMAGSLSDRHGPDGVTRIGIAAVLSAFVLMAVVPGIIGLVLGVVALDAGMQLAMISQQSTVLALDDELRGRINTVYVTALFIGGAVGSALASVAWGHFGWPGICALGAALALTALIVHYWGFNFDRPA